jgi:hypothetical protein
MIGQVEGIRKKVLSNREDDSIGRDTRQPGAHEGERCLKTLSRLPYEVSTHD